ncbi:MAG: cell wall-binding repeat-containing protein, partial [Acidimicrobiales bacterium]
MIDCRPPGRSRPRLAVLLAALLSALAVGSPFVAWTGNGSPWAGRAAWAGDGYAVTRLAGADRFETAALIATSAFSVADSVIVASADSVTDALAANFLAGVEQAPILLVGRDLPLPPSTVWALEQLRTKNIIVAGGPAAVSADVADALAARNSTSGAGGRIGVSRVGGDSRLDTMVSLAELAGQPGAVDGRPTALLAGVDATPDALALTPLSWARRLPVVLTARDQLSPQAARLLDELGVAQVMIAGGPAAVSPAVEDAVHAKGVATLVRFAGTDRSDTSRLVAEDASSRLGFDTGAIAIASGDPGANGADALALGPAAGRGGGGGPMPVLLTLGVDDPGRIPAFVGAHGEEHRAEVAGGSDAIEPATMAAVAAAGGGTTDRSIPLSPALGAHQAPGTSRHYVSEGVGDLPLNVGLWDCANIRMDDTGEVTFPETSGAVALPGRAGSVSPAPLQPAAGRLGFTVTSPSTTGSFCVVPVVFSHADGDTRLEIGPDGRPTEPFGIGGPIVFGRPSGSGAVGDSGAGGSAASGPPAIQAGTTVANAATQTVEVTWSSPVVCTGADPAQFRWNGRSATSLSCPGTDAVVGFAPGTLRAGTTGSLDYLASPDPAAAPD